MDEQTVREFFKSRLLNSYGADCVMTINRMAASLALEFNNMVPESADKTHALRQLRDSVMWMNRAIACACTDIPKDAVETQPV